MFSALDGSVRSHYLGMFSSRLFWQKFLCTQRGGAGTPAWYKMDQGSHYIRPVEGDSEVSGEVGSTISLIVETFHKRLETFTSHITRKIKTAVSNKRIDDIDKHYLETLKDTLSEFLKECKSIKIVVNSDQGLKSIIKQMTNSKLLSCFNFGEIENSNPSFMAFTNGIVDMGDGGETISFRAGKLEDFITKSTNMAMPIGGKVKDFSGQGLKRNVTSIYSENHPDVLFLNKYLSEAFPEHDLQHFSEKFLTSIYYGENLDKLCALFVGRLGNNSKSIIISILEFMFGDYSFNLPPESLAVNKFKSGGAASPELAQGDGARLAVAPEPAGDLELDAGLIKRITGGDRVFTRKLFENGQSKLQQYKVIIPCNDPPDLSSLDTASKNRFLIIPFLSTWTHEARHLTYKEQTEKRTFRINPHFKVHIPRLARALAWKLFHKYEVYKQEGLVNRPEVVKEYLLDYWKKIDLFLDFIEEVVVKEESSESKLLVADLYKEFISWFISSNPSSKQRSFRDFLSNVTRKECLGPLSLEGKGKGCWIGYSIKSSSNDKVEDTVDDITNSCFE